LVLDAWIEVAGTKISGEERLSIRPYPEHLEECVTIKSGLKLLLRPVRPEDEHMHLDFINQLTPEDLRMRFFGYVHDFPHSQMARMTQIDYDREMAFVAITYEENPRTIGVVRTFFDPDNISAEFAIVVRSDLKKMGLGTLLMEKMLRYCKLRGVKEIMAYTLCENASMQALGKKFGFKIQNLEEDPETIEIKLNLENLYI
jgi:acetyltransferase